MYGKMQKSGIIEVIPFIYISVISDQHPAFLQMYSSLSWIPSLRAQLTIRGRASVTSLTSVTSLNSEIPPVESGTTSGHGSEIHICRSGITWGKPLDHSGMTNQIPYDYTVKVRNRFKGLDLIECLMNYGQRFVTLYKRQGSRSSRRKRNAKKQMAVWGGLTNSYEKKRSEKQRRKGNIFPFECRVPKNSKER